MYNLVAIDLDDTLLNSRFELAPRCLAAIRQAQERGVIITLATGRMYCSAAPIARTLGVTGPLITYQGAWVRDAQTGETFIHRVIPNREAREIIGWVQERGFHLNIYVDDRLYMAELNDEGLRYAQLCRVEANAVGDLLAFIGDREPTKVLAVGAESELDRLRLEMAPVMGGRVHITKSKPHFLEFSHPGATKGAALAWLCGHYDVPREQTIAIGDSYNDLDMVEYAGLGVVVGNARDEIKARADYVTRSNDEDGVAEVLERFILKSEPQARRDR